MENNFKLSIPNPCQEDWDKMTPDETGRFCNSCVKSVVDFSSMSAMEIQQYFIKNSGKSVCGRFKNEQLDALIIKIPKQILFSQTKFHKVFLVALLISMPGIMICQTTNGETKKVEKVEIIHSKTDSSMTEGNVKVSRDRFVKDDTPISPERKARIEEQEKKRELIMKLREEQKKNDRGRFIAGVVDLNPQKPKPPMPSENDILDASIVDVKPDFPGGLPKFYDYINSNVKIPKAQKDFNGRLFFSFVINTDGSLTHIKLLRSVDKSIDNEVLRILESSPKWTPGEYMGKKVRVNYSIPIKITPKE